MAHRGGPAAPVDKAVEAVPTDAAPAAPAKHGPKSARFRSIRFKVVLMVTVSVVSLAVLWSFAANIALGEGLNLRHVETVQDHYAYPAGALGSALQEERRLTMVYLGSRDPGDGAALESGRLVTDRQADLFRRLARGDDVPGRTLRLADKIRQALDGLGERRRTIDARGIERPRAFADYTTLIGDVGALQGSLVTLDNAEVAQDARSQAELTKAREALAQENAWLAGVLAARRMTAAEHATFVQLVGAKRVLYEHAAADLRPEDREYYERVARFPAYKRLQVLEDHFVESRRAATRPGEAGRMWKSTVDSNITRLRGLELSLAANAEKRAEPISDRIITRVVLAGVLGLLAVAASLVIAVWVARSIIRELARLRREAIDLADVRLPDVVARLRRGEDVDAAAEAPPLAFAAREIDEVGEAFNAARRTAIEEAVAEAALRRNVSEVFVNLARRSQTLLHRQLKLLDAMERRIEEPDDLEDLFRVDHLATRMRRHAEGLIILSGRPPGRGWRTPVAVVDVARAAASEVEDYTRVNVAPMTGAAVVGPAVADVIHLLAELIENATVYSPPHTTVQVHGQAVAHGYGIEVEDRGLSMDAAALAAANERLATAEEFDLSDSGRLGLFVVGRLARRHGIKVTLRTSPYGGMTAIVLLPEDLVVRPDEPEGPPAITTRRAEEALVPAGTVIVPPLPGEDRGSILRLPAAVVEETGTPSADAAGRAGRHRAPLPRRRRGAEPPASSEVTSLDVPRPEGPGSDGPGFDGPGSGGRGSGGPGWDGRSSGGGSGGPGFDGRGSGGPGSGGRGFDGRGSDGPGSEGSGFDGPWSVVSASDAPESEGPSSEGSLAEGSGAGGSRAEGPWSVASPSDGPESEAASAGGSPSADSGADGSHAGGARVDGPSAEGSPGSGPGADGPRADGSSAEGLTSGGSAAGPRVVDSRGEGPSSVASSGEAPEFDGPSAGGSPSEGSQAEDSPSDGPETGGSRAGRAQADGSRPERQRALGDVRRRRTGEQRPPLPKRVRQENMAAQLREDEPAARPPASDAAEGPAVRRTPEEARAMMSSIQRGTRRGRAEVEDGEDSG
ncbi:nitrate- and nitrite sensing domain-containing protein [Actinomadura sp. WMMB 499]|uniref:nitrate- and nitrite sensing domain-containing protein n=1 Tax=Actinomadura sp. WMMB 499 TaxID=1219491 RepID=UPI001248F08C|nr:nitrate- and nitrite sensing domain-containing protein [Actinomadura sp. WMMB 499]QFG24395.1 HAMP domain-containing protein [Actinomadura sp. WMMB 499]